MNRELKVFEKEYEIIDKIGRGGNAHVYRVRSKSDNKIYALKHLIRMSKKSKSRFRDEIKILKTIHDLSILDGTLPIYESSEVDFWYTMPEATSIKDHVKKTTASLEDIINGVIQLSDTLKVLHSHNISHRDIKPDNLYYYNSRYTFGDFGLVDFPEKTKDLTASDRALGAVFTISPEMKRNPQQADGKKADVYSLAKTLWMLLTDDYKGFDGTYELNDIDYGLKQYERCSQSYLVELERLLLSSTANNPNSRPTMEEFYNTLCKYEGTLGNYSLEIRNKWFLYNELTFGENPPKTSIWDNVESIINCLKGLKESEAYNHILLPGGGGLDYEDIEIATEDGFIYIKTDGNNTYYLKPKCLYFESFNKNALWNYFLIELDELPYLFNDSEEHYETIVEDYPGHFVNASGAPYGVYDYDTGVPLPKEAKLLSRCIKGNIMLTLKNSPYNQSAYTYDGRHSDSNPKEFRRYMDSQLLRYNEHIQKGHSELSTNQYLFDFEDHKLNKLHEEHQIQSNKDKTLESYIKENICTFNFKHLLSYKINNHNRFYFEMEPSRSYSLIENPVSLYLHNDGYFKVGSIETPSDFFYTSNRNDAAIIKGEIDAFIKKQCVNISKSVEYRTFCSVLFRRFEKPTHLFTKQEIEQLMRDADDRQLNTLVANENGEAEIVTDRKVISTYPVQLEAFAAWNNYVGKYSSLSHLEDTYIMMLEKWLYYLENDERQVHDFSMGGNPEYLIKKIRKYY